MFVRIECSTNHGKCSLNDALRILKPVAQPNSLSRSDLVELVDGFRVSAVVKEDEASALFKALEKAGALAITSISVLHFVEGETTNSK